MKAAPSDDLRATLTALLGSRFLEDLLQRALRPAISLVEAPRNRTARHSMLGNHMTFCAPPQMTFPILAIPSPRSRSYEVAGESEEIVLVPVGPAVEESAGEVLAGGVEGAESATVGLDTESEVALV